MTRFVLSLALCLLLGACLEPRMSFDGFRGVLVGMTVDEAAVALGPPLEPPSPLLEDERSCYYVVSQDLPGVSFMVVQGLVARVDVEAAGPLMEAGVGIGSTEEEVLSAYPSRASIEPHPYTAPEGHYIVVDHEVDRGAVFETDGVRVLQFRAGRADAVRWIEGCL